MLKLLASCFVMSTWWQLLDAPRARCGGWGRWSGLWGTVEQCNPRGRSRSTSRNIPTNNPRAPLGDPRIKTLQPIFSVNNHLLVNRLCSVRHLQRQIAWKLLKKNTKTVELSTLCVCIVPPHPTRAAQSILLQQMLPRNRVWPWWRDSVAPGWNRLLRQQWKGSACPESRDLHQKCDPGLNKLTTTPTTKTQHKVYRHCRNPAF